MPEILPHPKRGTMDIGSERIMPVSGSIRAADGATDENPVVTIIGTDGSEDRHGSVINPKGWLTASYLRHPLVLWAHGTVEEYPALGQTVALRSVGGAWEFDIRFALGPWKNMRDNLAQFWWEWYRDFGGSLASSVAFLPKKWIDRQAKEMPSFFAENVEYTEQELTEISFVNVPSNRNAVTQAVARARSAGKFTDGLASMLGYGISPIVIRTQPEERMPVPKDKTPAAKTRADEPKPLAPELVERIKSGDTLTADEEVLLAAAGDDLRAVRTAAIAAKAKEGVTVLPTLSADVLRKKANGETLTREEQASVDVFARAVADLGITTAKETPASAFRAVLRESITALRCGDYYDDYYDPANYCPMCGSRLGTCNDAETVSPEDAMAEQATISALITVKTQQLSAALTGWSSAEHDALRSFCSDDVYNAMWRTERLWLFAEYWYDDLIPAAETPASMPDMMRKFTRAIVKDPAALKRAGAQFSAKNKQSLQAIHDHATEIATSCATMLSTSTDETTTTKSVDHPQVFRITGLPSSDRGGDSGQRGVSVTDGPDAGTGDRSTTQVQPNLYDAATLPVRR